MNSKLAIILIVVVVLIGGYLLMNNPSTQPAMVSENIVSSPTVVMSGTSPTAMVSTTTAMAPSEAVLNVATDPKLGKILVGANGMTLYMYTKDTSDTVTCIGDCAVKWPPLMTQGTPVLGEGVNPALVGITQSNGSKIVTYNHLPLYYWTSDQKAGDVTGQGVGGVWYVVSPEGKMVNK